MGDTRCEIYLHFAWSTKGRIPLLTPGVRDAVHNCLAGQVAAAGVKALATGGVDDHVHIVVQMNTTTTAAGVAKQMKGVSSLFASDQLGLDEFYWQQGYGVFSLGRSQLRTVIEYVLNQETHHAEGSLWPELEDVGDEPEDGH